MQINELLASIGRKSEAVQKIENLTTTIDNTANSISGSIADIKILSI